MLAEALRAYSDSNDKDQIVLGLPRGGVPVAFEVARAISAPLDVMIVRKLGVPGNEELAMGAIASGGVRIINDDVVRLFKISEDAIEAVASAELAEIKRRERTYREDWPALDVLNRTTIMVDDGIATGATMRAAIKALRKLRARRVIVAAPTASRESTALLSVEADDVVCISTPEPYLAVGRWYQDFTQVSDAEVSTLLKESTTLLCESAPVQV